MRKITLLLTFCAFTVLAMAYPQVLPIDYTQFFATSAIGVDPSLELGEYSSTSASIMANQWNKSGKTSSGEGGGSSPLVENSTLKYSNYVDNNLGKAIVLDPTIASGALRSTIYSLSSASEYRDHAFYFSVLVNFSSAPTSANDFLTWDANHTANSQRGRIFVKSIDGGIQFGLGYNGQPTEWSATLNLDETHLLVTKVTPVASGDEVFSLFINPQIAELESGTTSLLTTITQPAALKQIRGITVRQRPSIGAKLGGLRFSDNWADAVKASTANLPQLATPSVGTPSTVTSNGFIANWTTVSNAVSYDIQVYVGTNLVSTTNAPGQATSNVAITGLMSGMTYTYKVIAIGDGTTTGDSEASAASIELTTSGSVAAINTDFSESSWGTPDATARSFGSFLSNSVNDFDLVGAYLLEGSSKDLKGVSHSNRIHVDKSSNSGMVILPTVNSLGQLEIHLSMGSGERDFKVDEYISSTNSWSTIGIYNYNAASKSAGTDSIYTIALSRTTPTKLRIVNNTSSSMYLWQVITRTTNPSSLEIPMLDATSGISSTGFTANWTAVANATAYNVYVYQAGSEVSGSPYTVAGQATESLAITGLDAENAYTYTIQAVGDGGVSYLNSFMSAATAVTTGISTGLVNNNSSIFLSISDKTIITSEIGTLEVFNMQGTQVLRAENTNNVKTNLSNGMYIVRFTDKVGKQLIQKFSIK